MEPRTPAHRLSRAGGCKSQGGRGYYIYIHNDDIYIYIYIYIDNIHIYIYIYYRKGTIRYSFSLTELSTDEAESHILRLAALLEVVGHWSQLPHGGDGPFIVD